MAWHVVSKQGEEEAVGVGRRPSAACVGSAAFGGVLMTDAATIRMGYWVDLVNIIEPS